MVVAETTISSLASSPLIRMHSHRGFSLPMRSSRSRTSSQIAGVPPADRWRYVHFLRTSSWCHHQQPVPAAEARSGHLTPEHGELMAKDEDLHVVRPSLRRPSPTDHSTEEPVDQGEEHGLSLLPDRRTDPTKALLTAVIAGFCTPHPAATRGLAGICTAISPPSRDPADRSKSSPLQNRPGSYQLTGQGHTSSAGAHQAAAPWPGR